MKTINEYIEDKVINDSLINEGVLSWLKAFIKKIKTNQMKLIQNGKVKMLRMVPKKVKIQKEPASLIELAKDRDTMETWSNTQIGFPQSAEIAKNIKKYTDQSTGEGESEIKSNPLVYTFYYQGNSTYYCGILIYEKDIKYKDNYIHIISIDTNKVVDNPSEIQKLMLNQFKDIMNEKQPSFEGFTSKVNKLPPIIKGNMLRLGFKKDTENTEIYILNK